MTYRLSHQREAKVMMLKLSDIRIQYLFTEMAPRILCEVVPLSEIAFTIDDVMALRKYLMADNFIATTFSNLRPLGPEEI